MKKTITAFMALGLLFLSGCVTLSPSPTATPAPTDTPVPVLATSNDDIIGIWQLGSGTFSLFIQFNEDGTYRTAERVVTNLEDSPQDLGQFVLNAGLLTLNSSDESPLCEGRSGTFEVHLFEQGQIGLYLVEDQCVLRANTNFSPLESFSP